MKKIIALFLSLSLVFAVGCGSTSTTSIRFGSAAVGGMYSAFANAYTQVVAQDGDQSAVFRACNRGISSKYPSAF